MLTNGIWRCYRLELDRFDYVIIDKELDIGSGMIDVLEDPCSHFVVINILSMDEQKLMVDSLHVRQHSTKLFGGQGVDILGEFFHACVVESFCRSPKSIQYQAFFQRPKPCCVFDESLKGDGDNDYSASVH